MVTIPMEDAIRYVPDLDEREAAAWSKRDKGPLDPLLGHRTAGFVGPSEEWWGYGISCLERPYARSNIIEDTSALSGIKLANSKTTIPSNQLRLPKMLKTGR